MKFLRTHGARRWWSLAIALTLTVLLAPCGFPQAPDPQLQSALRKIDETLLSAVHRADQTAWASVTTSDFMYVEDGEISRRSDFLAGLKEDGLLPLVIESYSLQRTGDTAIVMHTDRLSKRTSSDVSRSKFLFLETWQNIAGAWKLRLIHIDRLRVDPIPVPLTYQQADNLVGTYRSGNDVYIVRRDEDHLVGYRPGGKEEQLLAETPDVLFIPGYFRLRKLIRFDLHGKVVGFVDRSVAMDRFWNKSLARISDDKRSKRK